MKMPVDPRPSATDPPGVSHKQTPDDDGQSQTHTMAWPSCAAPSLDPTETPAGFIPVLPSDEERELARSWEIDFRHSFWWRKRLAVSSALFGLAPVSDQTRRFNECGKNSWLMECSTEPGRFRVASDRCRNRWCDACAQERRRVVTRNLITELVARYKLSSPAAKCPHIRFLTLTLKASTTPLKEQLDRLFSCFGRFRHRQKIAIAMKGGIAFLELSRNRETGAWHPHLHVLFEGDFLPHAVARSEWHAITGDSFIVDVRAIASVAVAAGYVVKYATKATGANVWTHPESLREAIIAMVGRRTFNAFGTWRSLSLARNRADDLIWHPVCTLASLVVRARSGDLEASRMLAKLVKGLPDDPTDSNARDPTPCQMPLLSN